MSSKLSDRISEYQNRSDHKLLNRVPLAIVLNGRNFSKTTQLLDKPYCPKLSECLVSTTLCLCSEIEGSLFAYQHNDEIVIITRNDQTNDTVPWFGNSIQKICSATSAIASLHFNDCSKAVGLNMSGDAIFLSQVFEIPTLSEAINVVICKQQQNFHSSIQMACLYELINKYDRSTIKEMLSGLSIDEKKDLLNQECQIDFNSYPMAFRRGRSLYRVPKVIDGVVKNKWHCNSELPIYAKDNSILSNVFRMGADIFRAE